MENAQKIKSNALHMAITQKPDFLHEMTGFSESEFKSVQKLREREIKRIQEQ